MNWEEQLGIKVSALVAGLVGGIISLTFEQKLSFGRAVFLIFTGGVTSGYSFALAQHHFGLTPELGGVFGFTTGLVSMRLVNTIMSIAELISKNPRMLLSIFNVIKNGNTTGNSGDRSNSESDIHPTGKSDQ